MVWHNDDGLVVRFGTERATKAKVAEYTTDGPRRFIEILLNQNTISVDADGETIVSEEVKLPNGAHIEEVEIVTTEDWDSSGDGFIFDLGLIDVDRSSNNDVDDLIDAATQTEMNTGGSNVAGWVGAAVGATLTKNQLLLMEVTVADSTAGESVVRVYYHFPEDTDDSLIQS